MNIRHSKKFFSITRGDIDRHITRPRVVTIVEHWNLYTNPIPVADGEVPSFDTV